MIQSVIPIPINRTDVQSFILERFAEANQGGDTYASKASHFHMMLRNAGFELLGKGWYSTVWRYNGSVYKINSGSNGERDGFARWMLDCKPHTNPHLPRVGNLIYSGERYCVELEPLTPLTFEQSRRLFDCGPANITSHTLAEYARHNHAFNDAIKIAFECALCSYPEYIQERTIETIVDMIDCLDYFNVPGMSRTMTNLMFRGDTIVLNDPVAYTDCPIAQFIDILGSPMQLVKYAA